VAVVGDDPRLAARETDRVATEFLNRERQQRHGDAFAGREQHVELAPVGVGSNLLRHGKEIVRGIAHRRHDNDDVVPSARVFMTRCATRLSLSTSATLLPPYF
jgi:hypothetical protein